MSVPAISASSSTIGKATADSAERFAAVVPSDSATWLVVGDAVGEVAVVGELEPGLGLLTGGIDELSVGVGPPPLLLVSVGVGLLGGC